MAHLANFYIYKNYLQNLKYNVNSGCIFHLILVGILSILILSVKNTGGGWGGFCLWKKSVKDDESYLLTVPKLCRTQTLDIARLDPKQDIYRK